LSEKRYGKIINVSGPQKKRVQTYRESEVTGKKKGSMWIPGGRAVTPKALSATWSIRAA
jgi:hypothetical protein